MDDTWQRKCKRTSYLRIAIKAIPTASGEIRKRGFLFRSDCQAASERNERTTTMKMRNIARMVTTIIAIAAGTSLFADDTDDRFALHGRPAPENFAALKAGAEAGQVQKVNKKLLGASSPSYPNSIGGDKSYEYISSFTVTPKDGYYKITVKVICPKLYDADGYPGYGGTLEYVNVWIDWNGDYSWSDSERVMAKSSANYKKILADNKILYFETTVKDASTVGGMFKARAMLGWGYNPGNPATYSWTWGDVMDASISFTIAEPELYSVAVGAFAEEGVPSAPNVQAAGMNPEVDKRRMVIAGWDNPLYLYVLVRTSDRSRNDFDWTVTVENGDGEFIKTTNGEKTGAMKVAKTPKKTESRNGVEYGWYRVVQSNGDVPIWKPDVVTTKAYYGKHQLIIRLDCNESSGIDRCQVPCYFTYHMFYPAESVMDGKPMWYHMWEFIPKTGGGKFSYDSGMGKSMGQCKGTAHFSEEATLDESGLQGTGDINWSFLYFIGPSAWKIQPEIKLSTKYTQSRVDYHIDEVYRVVKHEQMHSTLHRDYKKYRIVYDAEIGGWQRVVDDDGEGSKGFWGFINPDDGSFGPIGDESSILVREWMFGDGLTDSREKEIADNKDKTDPSLRDTHGISNRSGWGEYQSYGDQEYYVRWSTDGERAREYHKTDWSHPGAQSPQGTFDESTGEAIKPTVTKKGAKNIKLMAVDNATHSATILSQDVGDYILSDVTMYGAIGRPDVKFVSFADNTADYTQQGLVFDVVIAEGLQGEWTFWAYLFDTGGKAVARAQTENVFDGTSTVVRFIFPTDVIAKTESSGTFVLGRVACGSSFNPMATVYSAKNVLTTKDYSAYECKVTKPILGSMMSDYSDSAGLHVVMPVTVPVAGTYAISAHLATTNGMNLVAVSTNCVCKEGKNGIDICFPKDAVFNTKMTGRFMVRDVSVAAEGDEPSLFVADYVTSEYDYSAFNPGNRSIVIQPNTIALSVSEDVDDPTGLYKGVAVRFTVNNESSSDYTLYRVSAILADANGYNVAYASEDLILNGNSSQTLFFSAQDIRESGKDGPYSVKQIRITDRTTGELIDACIVSGAKSKSVIASEFKGGLSVDENAICVTAKKAAAGWIEYLNLDVPVDSPSDGYVTISARVKAADGSDVGIFADEIEVLSGKKTVALVLDGAKFLAAKLNGPYSITTTVCHSANPEVSYVVERVIQTEAYYYKQFSSDWNGTCTLTFNANGGSVSPTTQMVVYGEAIGALPTPTLIGHTFDGWFTAASGGTKIAETTTVSEDVTYYAHWTANKYTVSFNANGGSVSPTTRTVTYGETVGTLSVPTWKFHTFDGWFTAADGGARIVATTTVLEDVTYYAHWIDNTRYVASESSGAKLTFSQAYTFVSCLQLPDDGVVAGTMTIKTQKEKGGVASATVTIQGSDGKKQTIKGTISAADGTGQGALAGLTFTASGVTGTLNGYDVEGVIDASKSKDPAMLAVLDAFKGKAYVMALEPKEVTGANVAIVNGVAGFSIVFAAKGKAKVTGALPDGTKVSASSQLIVGSEWCCLPIVYSKTGNSLAFMLWFDRAGNFDSVSGLTTWKGKGFEVSWNDDVAASKVGNLSGTSYFHLVEMPVEINGAEIIRELLPTDVSIAPTGAKWDIAKAETVKIDRSGNLSYGANPSGLKLTFTAKTGTFKGSFVFYTLNNGKLKKNTVTVSGVVVDGVGYGTASIKKMGCWPIVINRGLNRDVAQRRPM